jgi:signal transduction histidine kinase
LFRQVFPADRPALIQALRNAFQGDRIELDHRIMTREGSVPTVLLRGEVLGTEGMPQYLHGSYQDITERKLVETQLAAVRDEAREASAAKTAFLEAMSHEPFTPLMRSSGSPTSYRRRPADRFPNAAISSSRKISAAPDSGLLRHSASWRCWPSWKPTDSL